MEIESFLGSKTYLKNVASLMKKWYILKSIRLYFHRISLASKAKLVTVTVWLTPVRLQYLHSWLQKQRMQHVVLVFLEWSRLLLHGVAFFSAHWCELSHIYLLCILYSRNIFFPKILLISHKMYVEDWFFILYNTAPI